MNECEPLVSIYIPTKNRVELLRRAVCSVLSQDYKNLEVVIVDDGSDDSTRAFGSELMSKDSRVFYIRNQKSRGACFSRNRAIEASNGYYVTGLDDDDYFEPNRISDFVVSAKSFAGEAVMFYTDNKLIAAAGIVKTIVRPMRCDYRSILIKNYVGNQIFGEKKYFVESGGFDESLPAWQDVECWYRMSRYFGVSFRKANGLSYVVDQNHDHERISVKSLDRIQSAAEYFVSKHALKSSDRAKLMVNILGYQNKRVGVLTFLKFAVEVRSIRSVWYLTKLALVNLIKHRK